MENQNLKQLNKNQMIEHYEEVIKRLKSEIKEFSEVNLAGLLILRKIINTEIRKSLLLQKTLLNNFKGDKK